MLLTFALLSVLQLHAQKTALPVETVIQRGHEAPILNATYSEDGSLIVTVGEDQNAILWEASTGRQLRTFYGHSKSVTSADIDRRNERLITAGNDGKVILWNLLSGDMIKTYEFDHWLNTVQFSPDEKRFITAGKASKVYESDINSGEIIAEYPAYPSQYGINARYAPEGNRLLTGNDNGLAVIFERSSGRPLDTLRNISPSMCGGCWAHIDWVNEDLIIYGSRSGKITLYSTNQGKVIQEYGIEADDVQSIVANENHVVLIEENKVSIWQKEGSLLHELTGLESDLNNATISPDGTTLLTVGDDQIGRIWNLNTGQPTGILSGYLNRDNDRGLSFSKTSYWHRGINRYIEIRNQTLISPDGHYMVRGHMDSLALLVNINTGKVERKFGHDKMVITYLFSHDSKYLITAGADRLIKIWDNQSTVLLRTLKGHTDLIFELALSSDGKKLVSGSWDGSARLWDLSTGDFIQQYYFNNNSPYSISFVHNDQYLAIGSLDKGLRMIEIDSGLPARDFIGHTEIVTSVMAKDNWLISTSLDGRVKRYDIGTGLQQIKYIGHQGAVLDACFSLDGKHLFTAGKDRTARMWDFETAKPIKSFQGHEGEVTSVQVIKDGKILVTSSLDGTTRFWDIEKGNEMATYILFDENDWLTKTAKGYFDATQNAKRNVYFVQGANSLSLDQFFEEFYRPDILHKVLSSNFENQNNIGSQLVQSPPPAIDIISPTIGEKVPQAQIEMLVKITNMGGGIDEVRVLHNGKRLSHQDRALFEEREVGESIYQHIPLHLIAGSNTLTVSAFSKGRLESAAIKREIYLEGGQPDITCHVMVIGIDQYKNPSLNLNYATEDAQGFMKTIQNKGQRLFSKIKYYPVLNKEASKDNILKTLDNVAQEAKPQDVFFFYYAGHGSTVDGQFYFIPTENVRLYDSKKLNQYAILAADVQSKFTQIAALKQLVVLDACNAGSSTQILASRGAEEEKALAQLSRSSGVHVLAAAGSEQFAAEFEELGHGLFTYVLLEALNGKADGSPKDGKVTIYELKSYIDDQVPEYSIKFKGQPQFPVTYSVGQDFPVVMEED